MFSKKHLHFNTHMGRMGNQMFQYACAKNLELKHGFTCSMDDLSKLEYFELAAGERKKNFWKGKIFFHVMKRLFGMDVCNLEFEDMHQDYTQWLQNISKPSMVWAFFQSERYFLESAAEIKRFFKIKECYKTGFNAFLEKHKLTDCSYAAVHLRRTDYKGFLVKGLEGDDFTLPQSYYNQAMEQLDHTLPLIIVSDDPEFCKQEYGHLKNVIISSEDAATDFQILSNASELVISNSTYAWWAAWLNFKSKKVICPKYFLGFKEKKEIPVNIYPSSWQQILI